ncbi:MAG: hypothetical protein JRI97_02750 [Deltaproteobacteria bacterium]|nr:hypothetical protein [Deltaproteobacteria bacterium]
MKTFGVVRTLVLFAAMAGFCSVSGAASLDMEAGVGYMGGDVTFESGKYIIDSTGTTAAPFPQARAEYPLELFMGTARLNLEIASRLSFYGKGMLPIDDGDTHVTTTEWLYLGAIRTEPPAYYSRADLDTDAWMAEGGIRFDFYQSYMRRREELFRRKPDFFWRYAIGAGYIHRHFAFDEMDSYTSWPNNPLLTPTTVTGPTGTHEADVGIPYLELSGTMEYKDKFVLGFSIAASTFVHAEDKRDDLVNGVTSKASSDWDGEAVIAKMGVKYYMSKNWYASLDVEGSRMETDAEANVYDPSVGAYRTGYVISGGDWFTGLSLGYTF